MESSTPSSRATESLVQHLRPRVLKGSGCFANQNDQTTADFTLTWYPHDMSFVVEGDHVQGCIEIGLHPGLTWSLDGVLEDGRRIRGNLLRGDSVLASDPSKASVTFVPQDQMVLGDLVDGNPREAKYPLVGFYGNSFCFQDSDWDISADDGSVTSKQAKHLQQGWGLMLEGHTLCLRNSNAALEQYQDRAIQIIQLLSLACGTGITFNRQVISWGDDSQCEIYHRAILYEPEHRRCVPAGWTQQFLQQTLPVWASWQQEKRDFYRLVTDYIALANSGYLDTRIMQIWQAWEIIADEWGEEIKPCSKEKNLKTRLKQVWQEWRKQYKDADPSCQLWERISFAFKWKKALDKIQDFAEGRGLDLDKIGLNFRSLKTARDTVAHTGMMPADMSKNRVQTLLLLQSAQLGLQLILLLELGYTGLIETAENGWTWRPRIDEVLVSKLQDC